MAADLAKWLQFDMVGTVVEHQLIRSSTPEKMNSKEFFSFEEWNGHCAVIFRWWVYTTVIEPCERYTTVQWSWARYKPLCSYARLEVIRRAVHYVQSVSWVTWHELKVILTYTTVPWTMCKTVHCRVQVWFWQGLMVIHIPLCSELCARLCTVQNRLQGWFWQGLMVIHIPLCSELCARLCTVQYRVILARLDGDSYTTVQWFTIVRCSVDYEWGR